MIKIFIQSPDASQYIDPPVEHLLRMFPNRVHSQQDADVVLVPITGFDHFRFDREGMYGIKKPWVLVCYTEYGWDFDFRATHIWGRNTADFGFFDRENGKEWVAFDKFVEDNQPLVQFKRELRIIDESPYLRPIDYLCHRPVQDPVSKEAFDNRTFELMYFWGRSHESRVDMHTAIFSGSRTHGYEVVTQFDHADQWISKGSGRAWLTVHTPWYAREDMEKVLRIQGHAKVSIAMPGAGVKTFRDCEASTNAVMALPHLPFARAFPWTVENSILSKNKFIGGYQVSVFCLHNAIAEALRNPNLYDIYCAGLENARKYQPGYYFDNHIQPILEAAL